MNPIAEEMLDAFAETANPIAEDILMHIGMPRRSGRYPWGSGEDPYQRTGGFQARYNELKKQGLTEVQIAGEMGLFDEYGRPSTGKLRREKTLAKDEKRLLDIARAKSLKEDGLGPTEIGKQMGINESTVRSLLDPNREARTRKAMETAEFIKNQIDTKGMIDIGKGVEHELNISREKLEEALYILEREGYPIYKGGMDNVTNPGMRINQRVICPPGTEHKEIYNYDQVHALNEDGYISHDDGKTFTKFQYPASMDSKRLMVRYADDAGPDGFTGIEKDGLVEIRRGVADLSLGESHYAQVRIMVDNDRYIKGMAVYSDNLPDGVDVVFNTNKSKDLPMRDVLKKVKDDPNNPFGALIKEVGGQSTYTDKDGKEKLSLINKCREEGDWTDWKDKLPSQFLGKQSMSMIKKQLGLAKADKQAELDDILSLENPTIKKHFLDKFADECDSAAEKLQAAALPSQKYHVMIPINSLKDNEVYAPRYENGTKLALIRYPHGGTFEIPILTVNNKNKLAINALGKTSMDAVGVNKKNADRLSGADFDGDTVMAIPTHDRRGRVKITSTPELEGLKDFDPKMAYAERPGMKYMRDTQKQMGVISNLITDMTLAGANNSELAAAVRHSMVVIDAEKHSLDYKRSEQDNNISALKKKYQIKGLDEEGNPVKSGGASTILSRAKGQTSVLKRQGTPIVNIKGTDDYDPDRPEGALIYKTADDLYRPVYSTNKKTGVRTYTTIDGKKVSFDPKDKDAASKYYPVKEEDDTGRVRYRSKDGTIEYKTQERTQKSTQMAEVDDAYKLVSEARHPKELAYADYANSMKALANQARVASYHTGNHKYNSEARKEYKQEYDSLMSKLSTALKNSPRERAAQRQANYERGLAEKSQKEGGEKVDLKKVGQQALSRGRANYGAIARRDRNINITDAEWKAIQAGAVTETQLRSILANSDTAALRQRAMPRTTTTLSTAKIAKAKAMQDSNYTLAEIAASLGVSSSTISKALKGVK